MGPNTSIHLNTDNVLKMNGNVIAISNHACLLVTLRFYYLALIEVDISDSKHNLSIFALG